MFDVKYPKSVLVVTDLKKKLTSVYNLFEADVYWLLPMTLWGLKGSARSVVMSLNCQATIKAASYASITSYGAQNSSPAYIILNDYPKVLSCHIQRLAITNIEKLEKRNLLLSSLYQ